MKKGFTLVELLVVVLIVSVLSTVALPNYKKSMEKSRAAEAMNMVKSANDAVFAYASERNKCPEAFSKLLINLPGTKTSDTVITSRYFLYKLNAATNSPIPGTNCGGVVAERKKGSYLIWNPYARMESGSRTLACTAGKKAGINICKTLGLYTTKKPY